MTSVAPFGSWRSPITSDVLVQAVVGLSSPSLRSGEVFWSEARPTEGGRVVPVRRRAGEAPADLVPTGFSARTRVHEYGGSCTAVGPTDLWFTNFADQGVWRVPLAGDAAPVLVTPVPPEAAAHRYADLQIHPGGQWILAVRERHEGEVVNDVVAVAGHGAGSSPAPISLVGGHDFFSAPRPSPDGTRLAWLSWDHPDMPWDATILWVGDLSADMTLSGARAVAGGPGESVSQPRWSPDGTLHFLSDRRGWWNLYADDGLSGRAVFTPDAEMGGPDWVFGQSTYAFLPDGRAAITWSDAQGTRLAVLEDGRPRELVTPYRSFSGLAAEDEAILAVAGSPSESAAVVLIDVKDARTEVVKCSRAHPIDPAYVSEPRRIEYPTEGDRTAFGWYYPPKNPEFVAPAGERPPLVVMSHGGPTSQASSVLNPVVQYFTSRGLAVVDVDYGGSTGYGRAYRERLRSSWGIVDVQDCANAARWLADQGEVDLARLAIRGGSAGGYTTLAALAFTDVFAVGASHYGVADAAALARDTHKFESRYLDRLIGPWPEAQKIYEERSPIHHTEALSCPLILFQGLEDRVVPPAQAETMAEALRAKGIPFVLLTFEGEQHGFRRAETITRVIEAEMAFYGRVLGFTPADPAPELPIENEEALSPVGPADPTGPV